MDHTFNSAYLLLDLSSIVMGACGLGNMYVIVYNNVVIVKSWKQSVSWKENLYTDTNQWLTDI